MYLKIRTTLTALLCTFTCTGALAQSEELLFAVDVIRHGDRAPIESIPSAPWTDPIPLGHLSPTGMQQEFQLGEKFRDRYIKQFHLLPETYSPETMYVRSSDIDRTLISAESVLMGLYPLGTGPMLSGKPALPWSYQPIPIHTKPRAEDSLLVVDFNPKLPSTLDRFVHDTKDWKERTAQLQPQIKRWNQLTGMKMESLRAVAGLGDALYIYKLHNVPVPKGLTDEDVKDIISETEWTFSATFRPHQVGELTSHELLKVISDYFEAATQSKSRLKYVLFSAHDTTISGLMSILRDPVDRRPPYSSDLNFALFRHGAEFKVRINLNGKPVAASGFTNGEGSLKDLRALLDLST